MEREQQQQLDPITFEVLRHKLDEVIAEAYHTIGRVSGSPVVYEAGDHQEAICTADGDLAVFGAGVLHWVCSLGAGIKHVIKAYAESPGFNEDDQFMVNDPYLATVHANDVQLLAPIFYKGELIAWAGSASHQTDVGGIDAGSMCVSAQEFFQEGFLTPGIKLVERGVIRKDVEETFRNMVRAPDLGLLDLRAKIASNNVIKARLLQMVERYGKDTVLALFHQLIHYSEERVRARLREIPDGSWTSVNYLEGIREPHLKVQSMVTKKGDSLAIDMTGSSPQTAGSENIGIIGTMSSALDPFIGMLCYDIPWNEGLFKPVDFVLPEGTIINPRKPAAVSANVPCGGNMLVMTGVHNALSKMVLSSEKYRTEACGNVGGSVNGIVLAGNNRDGSYYATIIMDALGGGIGGFPDRDGPGTAQNHWCIKTMLVNVETNEMLYPFMYLWRKEVPDSGGPGKYRGGVGLMDVFIPWETPQMVHVNVGHGADPRTSLGLSGGFPAANTPVGAIRGAKVKETFFQQGRVPRSLDEIEGSRERIGPKSVAFHSADDVIYAYAASGGGGFGDPLERDPNLVLKDIRDGYVTVGMARDAYGVVIDEQATKVDEKATADQRKRTTQRRLEVGQKEASHD
ncbi:MAG: hydantoinase B/oxoprolinase family protein [Dehalococcoidia bacterium]|nr:hydantoinase B/oxoprolinase family protein [Dehalococcoidia bacterium]